MLNQTKEIFKWLLFCLILFLSPFLHALSPKTKARSPLYPQLYERYRAEIDSFTENERNIFEAALKIQGLIIGFDLDGTIIAYYSSSLNDFRNGKCEYFDTLFLSPGMKPLLIGLLAGNTLKIISASTMVRVEKARGLHPFLNKILNDSLLQTRESLIIQDLSLLKPAIKGTQIFLWGVPLTERENRSLEIGPALEMNYFPPGLKIPDRLGVDILFDDSSTLASILKRSAGKSGFKGNVFTVTRYIGYPELPFLQVFGWGFLHEGDLRRVTREQYDHFTRNVLPILDRLKKVQRQASRKNFLQLFFGLSKQDKEKTALSA